MTASRPARLRVGDEITLAGSVFTITALSAAVVALTDVAGQVTTVPVAQLLSDRSLSVTAASRPPAPLPNRGVLESLPAEVLGRAQWWERHLVEVLTGAPPDPALPAQPRPEYDPLRTSLRQRELAKVAELRAGDEQANLATVGRLRRQYQRDGLLGLIDGRANRTSDRDVDPRLLEAIAAAVAGETDRSTGTVTRLRRRVEHILTSDHGIDEPGTLIGSPVTLRPTSAREARRATMLARCLLLGQRGGGRSGTPRTPPATRSSPSRDGASIALPGNSDRDTFRDETFSGTMTQWAASTERMCSSESPSLRRSTGLIRLTRADKATPCDPTRTPGLDARAMLGLQRSAGNVAVSRLLRARTVQRCGAAVHSVPAGPEAACEENAPVRLKGEPVGDDQIKTKVEPFANGDTAAIGTAGSVERVGQVPVVFETVDGGPEDMVHDSGGTKAAIPARRRPPTHRMKRLCRPPGKSSPIRRSS